MRGHGVALVGAVVALVSTGATAQRLSEQEVATLTSLVTAALSSDARLDVLSSADVQQVMAFEGEKQAIGCNDDTSCMAEIAGAMGARLVVFGQLGALGRQRILTLNLFDAHAGQSRGRVVVKATSLEELGDRIDGAVAELTTAVTPPDETTRLKVVVLEIKLAAPKVADEPVVEPEPVVAAPSEPLPWLMLGGGAVVVLGVLAGGIGGALVALAAGEDAAAGEPGLRQSDAVSHLDARDGYALSAYGAWAVGALLVVAGGGAAIAGLVLEGE